MEGCNCFAPVGKPPGALLSPVFTVHGALRGRKTIFAGGVGCAASSRCSRPVISVVSGATSRGIGAAEESTGARRAERAGLASEDVSEPSGGGCNVLGELRREAEEALEWRSVCSRVGAFASTSMGREVCAGRGLPVGRDRGESQELLDQTAAAVLLPRPLDFSGVEDVSRIVSSAVSGKVLSIRELCAVERTLRAVRGVYEQMVDISSSDGSSYRIRGALARGLLRKRTRTRE